MTGRFVNAGQRVAISFEGRSIPAQAGQSVAAALYAADVRIFSRSFKYHRPRGLFCVAGDCPNCLMQVDGRPNVRTCTEPVQDGMEIVSQNCWPSLQWDLLRVFDRLSVLLPVGFYYKRFHRPRWLWPLFEHVVRHIAGLGHIDRDARPSPEGAIEHLQTQVCVIGGGPAGLSAAAAAAEAGADILLLDRLPQLGGHLLHVGDGLSQLAPTIAALQAHPRVQILGTTTAFGLYEGNLIGAVQNIRFLRIRADQIIVCTGGRQRPLLFRNNDLPGIFLSHGVLRLGMLFGVKAGQRAVVLTEAANPRPLIQQLQGLGIEVAAVQDAQSAGSVEVFGNGHLRAVGLPRVGKIPCDLLCLDTALGPAAELLQQSGVRFQMQNGCWRPGTCPPGVHAAGTVAGTFDLEEQICEGRAVGAAAARGAATSAQYAVSSPPYSVLRTPYSAPGTGKHFVCFCEDVTVKDLQQTVAEGFDHIETLKRYATVSMGPCQGRMCSANARAICGVLTGRDLNAVGTTTSRPPAVPVELDVLAAGQRHHPIRRTPLHAWHAAAGARWMDAGAWKRPESYGDAAAEVRAVRQAVGLIDVSTLGKYELIGPDAAELLERLYLNKWADLRPRRCRYGAMATEEGILFDDGVGARLGPDRFYITATTGNSEAVWQWLELWKATWQLDVVLINQTAARAAFNLAGPRAREVLRRLTSVDISSAAFPYLAYREFDLAGVGCRVMRLGFVGELGYEIHCPAAQAWHLWEVLSREGAALGLRPFGVEAQRILRLEKGHLIIGADTDALSNPWEAGLEGLVHLQKPQFHGREPLVRLKQLGPRSRLVGFRLAPKNEGDFRPESLPGLEGCQVVDQGRPVGRVTSARHSPTLGHSIGLAWVPPALAGKGEGFHVRWNGEDVAAVVTPLPFYDPRGLRMREG